MKVSIKVQPRAKLEKVEAVSGGVLKVWIKALPIEGKANEAVIKLLAKHFGVAKSLVRIVSGSTSRNKVVEIDTKT